ncbi:hypothetical protein GCM10027416_05170 [Okibacterium endophyticum]
MSIYLVGGPTDAAVDAELWPEFVRDAAAFARTNDRVMPRIAVVQVHEGDGDEQIDMIAAKLGEECAVVRLPVPAGREVQSHDLSGVDGLVVGGGLTPAYRQAMHTVEGEVRRLVSGGMPYLGVSAGAQIAAERAIVGGWRIGGVPVAPERAGEDLDEVTIEQGLGLVDISIDVHAAQWGTLGRLVAAVEATMVSGGVAIDENTALIVEGGGLRIVGAGSIWQVMAGESGVSVSTAGA